MKLLIVESPTKASTIKKYLGSEFKVIATLGHVRDLPEKELGIDLKNGFTPKFVIIPKAKKTINTLREEIKKASIVYFATDPDREGEAIAWHIAEILKPFTHKFKRITFHEITKEAIKEALTNPRHIDYNLVSAQIARRVSDRLIGYLISPLLWKEIAPFLSAGRVQSVALRLIVEREKEIKNFVAQEYWTITASFVKEGINFSAILKKINNKFLEKFAIKTKNDAEEVVKDLKGVLFRVSNVKEKTIKKEPPPPFTTSTLQQVSWKKFGWKAEFTMKIAQELYEKGYITYIRTDSVHVSEHALEKAKNYIVKTFGEKYQYTRQFETKSKFTQEAHEAIRPARFDINKVLKELDLNQAKLYKLIFERFIASQMTQAIFKNIIIELTAKNYTFQSVNKVLKFDGYLKIYDEEKIDKTSKLPPLQIGELLSPFKITPNQHFTEPPTRYDEASLIKSLEKHGIGRPSTYATILDILQRRKYVTKDKDKKFVPTELGIQVCELLIKKYPELFDVNFTAKMEESLDEIAKGNKDYLNVVKILYTKISS